MVATRSRAPARQAAPCAAASPPDHGSREIRMPPRIPLLAALIVAAASPAARAQALVAEGEPRAGRVAWWRADLGVERGLSNLVEGWHDASGNGFALASSGNGESQPEWLPVAIGGRPALQFDGNDW